MVDDLIALSKFFQATFVYKKIRFIFLLHDYKVA